MRQACIGGYWASSAVCTCPLCKHQFDERPQLSVNKVFALIADKFKEARYSAAGLPVPAPRSRAPPQSAAAAPIDSAATAGEEVVWCDVCTGVKRPATSSCLTCTASYCGEHEQPHRSSPFYAKHPLMDPRQALAGRTCALHRRLLEVSGQASVGGAVAFLRGGSGVLCWLAGVLSGLPALHLRHLRPGGASNAQNRLRPNRETRQTGEEAERPKPAPLRFRPITAALLGRNWWREPSRTW